jgi:uncharacterized integral membrane protein (TIGR00698 family)
MLMASRAEQRDNPVPGVLLCGALALAALGLQELEAATFGRAWLEAIVLAILLGAILRTAWTPGERWAPGIRISAKLLLEVAIVLLGASLSAEVIIAAGPALLIGVAAVVAAALAASYAIAMLLGLPRRVAILIACGNSICGNSAIAAVAPVIGADGEDVASSIAFTAVLGVIVVLALPLIGAAVAMTPHAYGVLAGLTVYAVPQVLAATLPVSAASAQVGTLVKLVRVLMLGPVVLALSLIAHRRRGSEGGEGERRRPPLHLLVPWFIIGFLGMAAARSFGLIPEAALQPMNVAATWLTVLAMAALGLGVDVRTVARAGVRVTIAVTLSLLLLGIIAFGLIHLLGLDAISAVAA